MTHLPRLPKNAKQKPPFGLSLSKPAHASLWHFDKLSANGDRALSRNTKTPIARSRGFTLVEVLVALFIMAILAGMAWQGVDGIVRARDASQARLEQTLRLNTLIAQWEQDLAAVQQTTSVPALTFDGASLRLTRRAARGLQLVVWSRRPGADGTPASASWMRWAGAPVTTSAELQESWMRTQQFQGNEAGQLQALTGLAQWQVYCFRGNAWSNCQSSGDKTLPEPPAAAASGAPAPVREALPTGVRLVLEFAEGSGMSGSLTRDVALGPQWP